MKFIKTIEVLNERAERNGVAKLNGRQYDYWSGKGDLIEKYRIEKNDGIAKLYHYETLTSKIDTKKNKVIYIYGESVSDVDSIGTFLQLHDINIHLGFKPVNGGFYIIDENGKEKFSYGNGFHF